MGTRAAKRKLIQAADLFCGAGGTSTGLLMAANEIGADLELIAINHWDVAIDTHSVNHPYAKHLCTGLDQVDPRKLVPGGRLNVLCASPECTHHSVARGGKPMSDQSRASAWHVLRFCEALYVENVVIENVVEFQSWGPLGANGRPLKSKRGELFQQFIASFRALGYKHVEWRKLNCADYGDPTTRERLFVICRRTKPIRWPEPTHTKIAHTLIADSRKPWRTAREIIDWNIPSKSIFERKRPLADKTLLRIQVGLKKFCGLDVDLKRCFAEDLRPFLVVLRGTGTAASVDEPLNTVTANGNHYGLVEPFLAQWDQQGGAGGYRGIDEPAPTVVTKANTGVVEPFLVQAGGPEGKGREPKPVDAPMQTVIAENHTGVVQPFLTHYRGDHNGRADGAQRNGSLNDPLPTQDTSNRFGIVDPFIVGQQSCAAPRSLDEPSPTIATAGAVSLTEPFLVPHFGERDGQAPRTHSIDKPSPTVTGNVPHLIEPYLVTVNHGEGDTTRRSSSVDEPLGTATSKIGTSVCEPFLIAYYGTKNMSEAGEPLPTVTARDRFGLVEAEVTRYRLDIRFRMLQPRELARAQGFPDSYQFTGNREAVVKQIGNAVPPNTAKALILEVLQ